MNKQEYTITVYTENQIGLLNRIAIIFSRRKINIESLNTSPSEIDSVHRFTIVINETEDVVRKLCRQIEKQVEVLKAYYNTNEEIVWQELAMYKVPTDVIHLDTGWFETDWRSDYKFSTSRFRDPAKMIADLKQQGFHISLWQYTYFTSKNDLWKEMVEHGQTGLARRR